tara:strand:+ start:610 stop:816 length:207 start_codon:yes stop_codon:yes gene_type:complete
MSTYYIIQKIKYNFPKEHFKHAIMKDSEYDLTTASEMLVAYRTINENEDVSFHLQEVDARAISKKEVA